MNNETPLRHVQIVAPSAEILDVPTRDAGIALLRKIEFCARISHRSEEAQGPETWDRFLRSVVLRHGDWSVTEHASVTVDAVVDRGIMAEWTRHRLGAYTVESTRFVNYEKHKSLGFIKPLGITEHEELAWQLAMKACAISYHDMVIAGTSPQIARSVLPLSLATRLVVTYNLRSWRHWFLMRTTKEAHPQMRQVSIPLLAQFQVRIPVLFEDLIPLAKQSDNLAKAR